MDATAAYLGQRGTTLISDGLQPIKASKPAITDSNHFKYTVPSNLILQP